MNNIKAVILNASLDQGKTTAVKRIVAHPSKVEVQTAAGNWFDINSVQLFDICADAKKTNNVDDQ